MLMIQLASKKFAASSSCFIQMSGLQEKDHGRNPLMTVSTMYAYNAYAYVTAKYRVSLWSVMLINAGLTEVVVCYHECVLSNDQSLCDAC
jgi:hypothetical protein